MLRHNQGNMRITMEASCSIALIKAWIFISIGCHVVDAHRQENKMATGSEGDSRQLLLNRS